MSTIEAPVVQWWLAKLSEHGNPRLTDGPHNTREGPERSLYIIRSLGLGKGERYAVARVELSPCEPAPHGAPEEAIAALNSMGLRP